LTHISREGYLVGYFLDQYSPHGGAILFRFSVYYIFSVGTLVLGFLWVPLGVVVVLSVGTTHLSFTVLSMGTTSTPVI